MSLHDRRSTVDGEPQLTVTVRGYHDVYRLAHHLETGQCEFADVGRRTKKYLRRKNPGGYRWLLDFMHGGGGFR